jgi:DNA-directed RNA polymerase subunit RPC12/RpoP
MTWLRKPKSEQTTTPQRCARCGEREGVLELTKTDPNSDGKQSVWFCAECARAVRNDPRQN